MDHQMSLGSASLHAPSAGISPLNILNKLLEKSPRSEKLHDASDCAAASDVSIDLSEVYFLIIHFLSAGPCQKTLEEFRNELLEHQLLPRRYHAWYSRSGAKPAEDDDVRFSFPLGYQNLVERYSHIEKDHLIKLLKQLLLRSIPRLHGNVGRTPPTAADVPTLLGTGSFSLLDAGKDKENDEARRQLAYLRWPHMVADQLRGINLREIGGGFTRHHRAPSVRAACYAIAKPTSMLQKMENTKKLRGHRDAVYCAIFDRSGRYVITGSDDRLVKIWSMETAFCLASCRGHEGDITDLAVSSNNALVASASNDFSIRVWRMPDGYPISVLREHTGAVTAIAFSPRPGCSYNLLSSSDDGTCRIWDARYSQHSLRIYLPKPSDGVNGKSNGLSGSSVPSSSNNPQSRQILCCAYNANGSVFVTGSSDTYARVWNACRSNTEQPDQPVHEMDELSGHEDDVNYVQFSGCAVAAKCSIFDSIKEEKSTKFKNSWFCHDNIVTCSRDGSAIIWIPRSRRSHGKAGRWTRAYHLKVPPPPMPPKPPRGGPRQRFLPTPRGVNMIIWSLDNRFVLAAIMDCRICVWNAADGSLVHSLTGHSQSTYVLDVHPFNPRIAMSAGYDGKTIVWDIWEGTPIRVYEIGHFKLVDGKFSPDGMSIVLSDDVGQIYLLSTGQGESQKDAKYDQFFLGDYRPLIRDANGNVIDQESQLVPYQRNIQDLLCDPSMIPYDEPYQSTYQKRRLGALNLEWRHPVIKFAIGPAATLEDYQLLPLAELEPLIDPVVEFNDTFFWEPEIEIHDDDTDPEYNVTEENATDAEQGSLSAGSFSHSDYNSEDSQNENSRDGLCRSRKKKDKFKVELVTSSGRHVKRKITNEDGDTLPGSSRTKKAKSSRRASKRRSLRENLSRPQRVAARNALNTFVQATVISTDDDNVDSLEDDSSDSDVMLQDSNVQSSDSERTVHTALQKFPKTKQLSFETFPQVAKSPELVSVSNSANKKRLILKISMRDSKKNGPPEETNINGDGPSILVCSSSQPPSETTKEKTINVVSRDPWSTDFNTFDGGSSENYDSIQSQKDKDSLSIGVHGKDNDTRCEELKDLHELAGLDLRNMDVAKMTEVSATDDSYRSSTFGESVSLSLEPKDNPPLRSAKLRIKMKKVSQEVKSPSKLKFVTSVGDPSIEEKSSDYGDHDGDSENMWPNSVSDATRRTRSKSLKEIALGKSAGRLRESVETASDEDILPTIEKFTSPDWMVCSKVVGRSRSSRNRNGNACGDGPSTSSSRNSNVQMRESSWLLLTEHEKAYRYIPQLGDEVIYLRQGHQEYIKASQSSEVGPWRSIKGIRAVEICEIANLVYSTHRGSGEGCCKLTLRFVDPFSDVSGRTFKLTLPELNDFPDFVIEKTWYDASIQRNWSIRDKCFVWWRDDSQEGGTWWEGRIIAVGPKDPEFPDSPWERYSVRYKSEGSQDPETHSPWELHSSRNPPIEQPCIDKKIRGKVLGAIYNAEASDGSGIAKLNEVARKLDYLNRFPVPLYPEVIVSRLEKNYYRRFEALEHDVAVMMSNAESYFSRNNTMSEKMARLSKRFSKILSREQSMGIVKEFITKHDVPNDVPDEPLEGPSSDDDDDIESPANPPLKKRK